MLVRSSVLEAVQEAKLLVFDFDGTLVYSNPIKWRAFERLFAGFQDRLEEIMSTCRGNPHTPRWDKFRYVYEKILKIPYSPEVEERLLRRFDEETRLPIVQVPEIPGASRFLAEASKRLPLGLLSSTPHEILLEILQGRGWRSYFQLVQGAPVRKSDWLKQQRNGRHLKREKALFFGDTEEDAKAASQAGWIFVQVGNGSSSDASGFKIHDFAELLS